MLISFEYEVLSKWKFGQILAFCLTDIPNMFLNQCWRLETSSGPFIVLFKWQYSEIWQFLMRWNLPFLIVPCSLFQKTKHWNLEIIGYWIIGAVFYIEKDLEPIPSPPNCSKTSWKLLPLYHGSIIQTVITCKKIPCYMCDSTCR